LSQDLKIVSFKQTLLRSHTNSIYVHFFWTVTILSIKWTSPSNMGKLRDYDVSHLSFTVSLMDMWHC